MNVLIRLSHLIQICSNSNGKFSGFESTAGSGADFQIWPNYSTVNCFHCHASSLSPVWSLICLIINSTQKHWQYHLNTTSLFSPLQGARESPQFDLQHCQWRPAQRILCYVKLWFDLEKIGHQTKLTPIDMPISDWNLAIKQLFIQKEIKVSHLKGRNISKEWKPNIFNTRSSYQVKRNWDIDIH